MAKTTNASDNKSLADNIGWFWVFAGVDQKLFKNGPFANINDAAVDARSKIHRDEIIAFVQIKKDDGSKSNKITDIQCKIVKAWPQVPVDNIVVERLSNQFAKNYRLVLPANILDIMSDTVAEIVFPAYGMINIIALRSLSDFLSVIRLQEDKREAMRT